MPEVLDKGWEGYLTSENMDAVLTAAIQFLTEKKVCISIVNTENRLGFPLVTTSLTLVKKAPLVSFGDMAAWKRYISFDLERGIFRREVKWYVRTDEFSRFELLNSYFWFERHRFNVRSPRAYGMEFAVFALQ